MRNGSQSQLSTKNTLKDGMWWRRCGGLLLGDHELWTGSSPSLDLRYAGAKARRGQKSVEPTCSHQHWHCTVKSGLQRAFYIFFTCCTWVGMFQPSAILLSTWFENIFHLWLVWVLLQNPFMKLLHILVRSGGGWNGEKEVINARFDASSAPQSLFNFLWGVLPSFVLKFWWNNLNLGYLVQQSSTEILKT